MGPWRLLRPAHPPTHPHPLCCAVQFSCFCHSSTQALPRCRRPDAAATQFPEPCKEGDVLAPLPDFTADPEQRGTSLRLEPHSAAEGIAEVGHSMGG